MPHLLAVDILAKVFVSFYGNVEVFKPKDYVILNARALVMLYAPLFGGQNSISSRVWSYQ